MLVNVTQEHIDKGRKKSRYFCPIALALRDLGYKQPFVTTQCCKLSNTEIHELPDNATQFIGALDTNKVVYPFSFELPDN